MAQANAVAFWSNLVHVEGMRTVGGTESGDSATSGVVSAAGNDHSGATDAHSRSRLLRVLATILSAISSAPAQDSDPSQATGGASSNSSAAIAQISQDERLVLEILCSHPSWNSKDEVSATHDAAEASSSAEGMG